MRGVLLQMSHKQWIGFKPPLDEARWLLLPTLTDIPNGAAVADLPFAARSLLASGATADEAESCARSLASLADAPGTAG